MRFRISVRSQLTLRWRACGFANAVTVALASAAMMAFSNFAAAQVGLEELAARIGIDNVPTGKDVVVSQVEALNTNDNYRPNPNHAEFDGKTFTLMSGPSGNSGHATTVGRHFYGLETSVAPGIDEVFCYSALGWLQSDLLLAGSGSTTPPLAGVSGVKIYNNSWIASLGFNTNDAVRRADFLVLRDDVLIISGVNNAEPQFPLMMSQFNGISVGRSEGGHASGDTPGGSDVPGRMKPELVAPVNLTSYSTGLASSAAAMMVETARTPPLDANPLAQRSEVLKAVLLGGAVRGPEWTNNPEEDGPDRGKTARPLDEVFGAGEVNVNNAHLMLTGGQFAATSTPPPAANLCRIGWALTEVDSFGRRYWRFRLPQQSQTLSILLTWHRQVDPEDLSSWTATNCNLTLWRIGPDGNLQSMVGPAGEAFFTTGNIASESPVDNVELIHVHNLEPGDYVIEARRVGSGEPIDIAVSWIMDAAVKSGDLNADGAVGVADLLLLLASWGSCADGSPSCEADLNCDSAVGVADLLQLLSDWG